MAEPTQQQQGATVEQVAEVVAEAFEAYSEAESGRADALAERLDGISADVAALGAEFEASRPAEGCVYEVRATASQVETAKSALRILCTEGLLLVVVMSICAGLMAWRAFSGRWI